MLLSIAIATGRFMVNPKDNVLVTHREDEGCALGMAGLAAGLSAWDMRTPEFSFCGKKFKAEENYEVIEELWPWLCKQAPTTFPCGCQYPTDEYVKDDVIIHLFDLHVFGEKDWTLDQLIDWVRSVEPQETEASPSPVEAVGHEVNAGR